MADIKPFFEKRYLRQADKTSCLVSTVYDCSRDFAEALEEIDTPFADVFVEKLQLDSNGNLLARVKTNNGSLHTLMLNHPHKTTRGVSEVQRLQKIKDNLKLLKIKIVENMVSNIRDQCSEETFFYNWSGLDLEISGISIRDRINRMDDLWYIFCQERVHLVCSYKDKGEKELIAD